MSLQDIRSECTDTAALLQPYVDGELASAEQERVAAHLEGCRPCRSAVSEQQWVRATLRAVERDRAPASLRARVMASLDAIDAEAPPQPVVTAAASTTPVAAPARPRRSLWSRMGSAIGDLMRGALVMVPASAVAAGLFLVAREGFVPVDHGNTAPGLSAALGSAPKPADTTAKPALPARPGESLPPVAAPARGELQLVRADVPPGEHGAGLAGAATPVGARLRYQVLRSGQPTGQHVIDHQAPLGHGPLQGLPVEFRGHQFFVDQTQGGEPSLRFDFGGVAHMLVLEGGRRNDDISVLLELAEQKLAEASR
ncbi:MAG: zf-HC2 domain-containing protein [Nannocystaceae bacterium]